MALLVGAFLVSVTASRGQGTAFTYQGRFQTNGVPYTGSAEFQFTLWDAASGGASIGANSPPSVSALVNDGLFTVTLDFGLTPFNGQPRFLQIDARTSLGAYTTLNPRQPLTGTPYAIRALNVQPGGLPSGTYSNPVVFDSPANVFTGDGTGLTGLNASQLTGGTIPTAVLGNAWQVGGNAGLTPGAQFLGTTDNSPLEIRVNNLRAFRIEPTSTGPNLIGGYTNNSLGEFTSFATISGGTANRLGTNASGSVIAGGSANRIGTNSAFGAVGGGFFNRIAEDSSSATIAGGENGAIGTNARAAAIGGGSQNRIGSGAEYANINGGFVNRIGTNAVCSTIGGGSGNLVGNDSEYALVAGGTANEIGTNSPYAAISGGAGNRVLGEAPDSTIAGGRANIVNRGATNAFAAGRSAWAAHAGTFVWADLSSPFSLFASTRANQFSARAAGGVRFETAGTGMTLDGQPVVAGSVGPGQLTDGAVTEAKLADNAINGAKIADGSIQPADVALATFDTTFWRAGGNAGTAAGTHFVGTTDNQALEFKVNGQRALRLEPTGVPHNPNVIGGSILNTVGAGSEGVTIAGGSFNVVGTNSAFGTIGGGSNNRIGTNSFNSTIAGGSEHSIMSRSPYATIAGGRLNDIDTNSAFSSIGGGFDNNVASSSRLATIAGGQLNTIGTNSPASTIGGGDSHKIAPNSEFATIPGGFRNSATNFAFAAGTQAKANHTGAFVWADSQPVDFPSTTNNQVRFRASGGLEVVGGSSAPALKFSAARVGDFNASVGLALNTNASGNSAPALRVVNQGGNSQEGALSVSAAGTGFIAKFGNSSVFVSTLTTNGTWSALAFNPTSDRAAKENFTAVKPIEVLEKVAALPMARWTYKAAPGVEHLGPVAQDFHAAFGLNGDDDKHIATVDADGVALAAIQGLNEKVERRIKEEAELRGSLEARLQQKDAEISELKESLGALRAIVRKLNQRITGEAQ